MRQRVLNFVFACLLVAFAGAAHAQYKLSEILDKGGKRLSGEEVRALLVGATVTGALSNGAQFESHYTADGKVAGTVASMQGMSSTVGTWIVGEKGDLCADVTVTRSGAQLKACSFYFKAGDEYFSSTSDSDRNATAAKRNVRR
jgi:hypothetical protein